MIEWQWCSFDELSAQQLYAVLAAREAVFVVEQACAYQELDGLDLDARHLVGWSNAEVAAYLRVLNPGTRFAEPSIGRVLTARSHRGTGIGRTLVAMSLDYLDHHFPAHAVRISAQTHLQPFYSSLGFAVVSGQYLEDGIPHVEMLRPARRSGTSTHS
jgi:ElaA protein